MLNRAVEQHGVEFVVVLDVDFLLAALDLVQRRLRDIDVTALDEQRNLTIEKGQQQRAYVRAVDIRVSVVAAQSTHAGDEVLVTFN